MIWTWSCRPSTLREQLTLHRSDTLNVRMPGSFVPVNDKNTAVKAAMAFFHYTGLLAGVDITIRKTGPCAGRHGGGSADAAGVLVGMNELYGARLSMSELCALGATIGADVPFALHGRDLPGTGRGGLHQGAAALPALLVCGGHAQSVGVSTPEAFQRYDTMGSPTHPDCQAQEDAIRAGDLAGVCRAAGNALEHCSGAEETPAIRALLDEAGACTSLMTGSAERRCSAFLTTSPRPAPPAPPCKSSIKRCIWQNRTWAVPGSCTAAPSREKTDFI